jgi:3-dehydroquinate synthase
MLKHGLIFDQKYWEKLQHLSQLTTEDLEQLIYESIVIKNAIVLQDPTENGIRKALNFGHTLGHAIESYFLEDKTKKTLLHGEAIAIGMILESYLSLQKRFIKPEEYLQIKATLQSLYPIVRFTENDIKNVMELLIHDKKNEHGTVQYALLNGIGGTKINQLIEDEWIIRSFVDYQS